MNVLTRGPAFIFKDKSLLGVSILEVYSSIDPDETEYCG
jgi:hypothetical protein